MAFPPQDAQKLLAECHRRCCVCHRFCGVKMELDHIIPKSEGGPDDISNAIPVCFECHVEIHSYNDAHPRGRKFQPGELILHKEQWLEICAKQPEILVSAPKDSEVGPLQAMVEELEYNSAVVGTHISSLKLGALFLDEQFRLAMGKGAISLLNQELKDAITDAYLEIQYANQRISRGLSGDKLNWRGAVAEMREKAPNMAPKIETAREKLLTFLGSEED